MSWLLKCRWSAGAAGLTAVLILAASPAAAQSAAQSRILFSFNKLEALVTGRIVDRCEVSGGGTIDFGELSGGETAATEFGLQCNTPFDLGVETAQGGLTHTTTPMGQGPYAGRLRYTVDVKVPTRISSGAGPLLHRRFDSADLASKKMVGSGEAIAAGGGQLVIQTAPLSGAGLLAGDYADALTVTVASRL